MAYRSIGRGMSMNRRRRKHKPLTKEQIKELRRLAKNRSKKARYKQKQRELFFAKYSLLCKKYGCYVGGWAHCLTGLGLRKADNKKRVNLHLEDINPKSNEDF